MSGNVEEICWDIYGLYSSEDQENPTGSSNGNFRLLRGGGWASSAEQCSVASRSLIQPGETRGTSGFRLVRSQK